MAMLTTWFSLTFLLSVYVSADYECVCTYNIETPVYSWASQNGTKLGYMYEFDCRPTANVGGSVTSKWKTIAYQHQVGYLLTDSQITTQICPGSPSNTDILTPTVQPKTSKAPTSSRTTTPTTVSTTKTTTTSTPSTPSPLSTSTTTTTKLTTTTTRSTTQRTTARHTTSTLPSPSIPGNVRLCPHTLHQYTIEDKGALAQFGDSCYEIVPIQTTWLKGEKDCVAKGGHLFHISSQQEQDFILAFINFHQFAHACWMGLHDQIAEEMFEWTSGDNVTYTNWWHDRYGNIMSHHQEDCVLFVPYSPYFGKWDDVPCGYTDIFGRDQVKINPFICQFSIHGHYTYAPLSSGTSVFGKRALRDI